MANGSQEDSPQPHDNPKPAPESWGWSPRQRAGLAILLALLIGFLIIQYVRHPARLDDPLITYDNAPVTLPARIDPNTATETELARIPRLGEKMAAKIVEYRTKRQAIAAGNIVFREPEDLTHIPGIGKATMEQLRPYLQFPEDTDTQPAP